MAGSVGPQGTDRLTDDDLEPGMHLGARYRGHQLVQWMAGREEQPHLRVHGAAGARRDNARLHRVDLDPRGRRWPGRDDPPGTYPAACPRNRDHVTSWNGAEIQGEAAPVEPDAAGASSGAAAPGRTGEVEGGLPERPAEYLPAPGQIGLGVGPHEGRDLADDISGTCWEGDHCLPETAISGDARRTAASGELNIVEADPGQPLGTGVVQRAKDRPGQRLRRDKPGCDGGAAHPPWRIRPARQPRCQGLQAARP